MCQEFEQCLNAWKQESQDSFELQRLNYGQYRVTTPYKRIDFFLRGKRYHDITNQVRGGLEEKNVLGIYKQKSDARRAAADAIKEYETSLKEMEDAMEAFRTVKKDIEEKKASAKEKIMKLK